MGSLRTILDIYYGWMNCIFLHKMQISGNLKSKGHSERNGVFLVYFFLKCVNLELGELVKLSAANSTVRTGSGVWRGGCGISVIFTLQ